jgi:polyisoprenoid-binding protein YceI
MFRHTILYVGIVWSLAGAATGLAKESPPEWLLDPTSSSLQFIFDQAGSDQQGEFNLIHATFRLDPLNPDGGYFDVTIDVAGLDTGEPERDQILHSADMFAVEKWPLATFHADNIRPLGGNRFVADAELSIRDQTRKLSFPFSLQAGQNGAAFRLQAELTIKRLDFGVGQGDWLETTWIADEVGIKVDVHAKRSP